MRVLHVAECTGGVERYLRYLLKYSTCENILILSQLYKKEEYKSLANHIEIVNMEHNIGISAIKEAIKIRTIIKKFNPNIVYAHSSIAGAITRMACIGLKSKIIYNPHGWSFNMESKKRKIFIILERIMAYFCDMIICISEAEKESAIKRKICKKNKIHVIYNGIDISEYKNETIQLPIPNNAFVVGMVGRICKQKAPDIFIRMAGEVQKKFEDIYFIIVGDVIESDKEERKKIEILAKKLKINLLITGWVKNPLIYMNRFDIGCLFSRWEGFGLVIPEYMLTSTPIVATEVDAIPYLIKNGVTGVLVEKDNWKMAAIEVIKLIENKEKRKILVKNGLEVVYNKFDAKRVARECEELYLELVK